MAQALQRLGDTMEFATEILEILRRCGWDVGLTKAFGSTDDQCSARKPGLEQIVRTGKTPLEAAHAVFKACAGVEELRPRPIGEPAFRQLRLV